MTTNNPTRQTISKTIVSIILLVGFTILFASNKTNLFTNFLITGSVTHSEDSNPIEGVIIIATPLNDTTLKQQTTTDNLGNYNLDFTFVGFNENQLTNNNLWVSSKRRFT